MRLREHPAVRGKRDAYPLDPRLLKIDPSYNVRDLTTPDAKAKLAELKESIRANGVRVPLEIRLQDDDIFVVAGHRRHAAVMELIAEGEDIKSVLTIAEPDGTNDAERALGLVVSNSGVPLTQLEISEVVRRLVAYGWDKAQIAKRMGWKSVATVTQKLDNLAIPHDLQVAAKRTGTATTTLRQSVETIGAEATRKIMEDNEAQGKKTRPRDIRRASGKDKPKPKTEARKTAARQPEPKLEHPASEHHPDTRTTEREPERASEASAERELGTFPTGPVSTAGPSSNRTPEPLPVLTVTKFIIAIASMDAGALAQQHLIHVGRVSDIEGAGDDDGAAERTRKLVAVIDAIGSAKFPDEWDTTRDAAGFRQDVS